MRKQSRRLRHTARYWDDPTRSPSSLGCSRCVELATCGGLHIRRAAFDCLSFCCEKPATCSVTCPRNSDFVDRVREIGGFDLHQLARAPRIGFPELPPSVPLIYSKGCRSRPFQPTAVALSLYQLVNRSGGLKFETPHALRAHFGIASGTLIILSGTEQDRPIERWWSFEERRREAMLGLRALGIVAATTPNFSLFSDVPRFDNLHAMKRIAICWQEMTDAGMPTALHVNARTSRDFQRWTELVARRPEVSAIAYEFATGASGSRRMPYHLEELRHLADRVRRPLTLIVRGALSALGELRQSYARVAMIDTTSYMRTVNRQVGRIRSDGRVRWSAAPGQPRVDTADLLDQNHRTMLKAASRTA